MNEIDEAKLRLLPEREEKELKGAIARLVSEKPGSRVVREVALAGDGELSGRTTVIHYLSPKDIGFGSVHLRQTIAEPELEELAKSISAKGILQPILVRNVERVDENEPAFEIVAGGRRLRAAVLAGEEHVPVIVQDVNDREALEFAIIENAQREDLNPVEEALSYKRLIDDYDANQTEIARIVGKNRATISNSLRLLQLEPEVLGMLSEGEITAGHARALLMIDDPKGQLRLARKTVSKELSVRALESIVARLGEEEVEEELTEEEKTELATMERLRNRVSKYLGVDVHLHFDAEGRKRLQVTFPSEASWKRFISRIRRR